MKLYRHYKNKNYKFFGIAKHSETLEDMVVYKPLYANSEGNLWVRPKDMFFENVLVNEKNQPRFKGVLPDIKNYNSLDADNLTVLTLLMDQIFKEWDLEKLKSKLAIHSDILIQVAYFEMVPVGFKVGYKITDDLYYSWLGGVLPDYRGLGVAEGLMAEQHTWCLNHGFKKIQTKTKNSFKDMLILNLKSGFSVIDVLPSSKEGESKILLEKTLINP